MKYAVPFPGGGATISGATPNPAAHRAEQPIDRRPFLGSAREIEAPEQHGTVEPRRREDGCDQFRERLAQRGKLRREAEHASTAAPVAFARNARQQALVEPRDERIEFPGQGPNAFPV